MTYRVVLANEAYDVLISWLETHDIPYDQRAQGPRMYIGLAPQHWRRVEYLGLA